MPKNVHAQKKFYSPCELSNTHNSKLDLSSGPRKNLTDRLQNRLKGVSF